MGGLALTNIKTLKAKVTYIRRYQFKDGEKGKTDGTEWRPETAPRLCGNSAYPTAWVLQVSEELTEFKTWCWENCSFIQKQLWICAFYK